MFSPPSHFLLFLFLLPGAAFAQFVFPDLTPADAAVVLSLPDAGGAWHTFSQTPLRDLAQQAGNAAGLNLTRRDARSTSNSLEQKLFFGEMISCMELSVLPEDARNGATGFLWVGGMRNPAEVRTFFQSAEREILAGASASKNVTRTVESIGNTAVTILTDAEGSIGWAQNGPRNLCLLSNKPNLLRKTVRTLEAHPAPTVKEAVQPTSFTQVTRAWQALTKATPGVAYDLRFFVTSPQNNASAAPEGMRALDPLLNTLQPRGGMAGGIRFSGDGIRVDSFALFPADKGNLTTQLYATASPVSDLPGSEFVTPNPLFWSGNALFNPALLKRYLAQMVERWNASLAPMQPGKPQPSALQANLTQLKAYCNDADFFAELGPNWFFAVNRFEYGAAGEFPRIDFVLGFQTRQPEKTLARVTALEKELQTGVQQWLSSRGEIGNPPRLEQQEVTVNGAPATLHIFRLAQLPAQIQPAWIVTRDHLLFALTPETLVAALERKGHAGDELAAARNRLGMQQVHAFQVLHPDAAARIIAALVDTATGIKRDPAQKDAPLSLLPTVLEKISAVVLFRQGNAEGVHTAGEVLMKPR